VFAIESALTIAYERLSLRALGFFVVHVDGRSDGLGAPDSTMLACSFDSVKRRIADRGNHLAPFAAKAEASEIANALNRAPYVDSQEKELLLGISSHELAGLVYADRLLWAPDGDEAFDDGSYILQFDVDARVRLIAFRRSSGFAYDPASFSDLWLPSDTFYGILQQWCEAFEADWIAMPNVSDRGAG